MRPHLDNDKHNNLLQLAMRKCRKEVKICAVKNIDKIRYS